MTKKWRVISVDEAIGRKAAHDITVVTEISKGPVLRRGDLIGEEHIEILKKAGHYLVAVIDEGEEENLVWEDEAVLELAKTVCRRGCEAKLVGEGKAYLIAEHDGLLKVDEDRLASLNSSSDFLVISLKNNSWVRRRSIVAVSELVPLYVSKNRLEAILGNTPPLMEVKKPLGLVAGLVVTGTEVYEGRTRDLAEPVVRSKLESYGCFLGEKTVVPDDERKIAEAVLEAAKRYDLVVVTGGMSVDPTDVTPQAIGSTGARIVAYGIPVKPTTMSMLAYLDEKPVVAVSSGVIYFREENVLDVLLPRICVGEKWERDEVARLGSGGLMSSFIEAAKKKLAGT